MRTAVFALIALSWMATGLGWYGVSLMSIALAVGLWIVDVWIEREEQ